MIRAIRWIGELEVEGRTDADRISAAYMNGTPVEIDGRKCQVVMVQPEDRAGRFLLRADVEEILA